MELRTAEQEVERLVVEYKSLCQAEARLMIVPSFVRMMMEGNDMDTPVEAPPSPNAITIHQEMNAEKLLSTLTFLQEKVTLLQPKMERFEKRLGEKDPITETPRYGEKTASRVKSLLQSYKALEEAIRVAFESTTDCDETAVSLVQDLKLIVQQEQEKARLAAIQQEQVEQQQLQQEEQRQEQRLREEEERKQQELLQRAQQEADLARRAQEVRAARQQAQQRALEEEERQRLEQERIDREWMDTIPKGPDGVRQQLAVLKQSTVQEPGAHLTAVTALHTLFSQIVAHPEEINFRRVRRDHAKFHQDIGRHKGGREVLIAAGFRLGAIDDVPCYISTEPNLETQLDEWSEWYDLLKATLNILEQELIESS